jgi:release factor glutamine methyltransferase
MAATVEEVAAALRAAGCLAAEEEAAELVSAAGGDGVRLDALVARRRAGEPLAWLTGSVRFCGVTVHVRSGVYVPRWQTEPLAAEAAERLPVDGRAVDLCTGAGAVALVLARRRPRARVLATELQPTAVECARANGVEVVAGDMAGPVPRSWRGAVDVVTAVVPYVPTGELALLPRDVITYEPRLALDGGPDGTDQLRRAARAAEPLLQPGGSLLLELGGDQADTLRPLLEELGYQDAEVRVDADGDVRAVVCHR